MLSLYSSSIPIAYGKSNLQPLSCSPTLFSDPLFRVTRNIACLYSLQSPSPPLVFSVTACAFPKLQARQWPHSYILCVLVQSSEFHQTTKVAPSYNLHAYTRSHMYTRIWPGEYMKPHLSMPSSSLRPCLSHTACMYIGLMRQSEPHIRYTTNHMARSHHKINMKS